MLSLSRILSASLVEQNAVDLVLSLVTSSPGISRAGMGMSELVVTLMQKISSMSKVISMCKVASNLID